MAILCILAGTVRITLNDVLIKALSAGHPSLQMVFLRAALIGQGLLQAYRQGWAATIARFEYLAVPMAVVAGFVVYGDVLDPIAVVGITLILSAGLITVRRDARSARA